VSPSACVKSVVFVIGCKKPNKNQDVIQGRSGKWKLITKRPVAGGIM